ncbi:MAG: hypothetical protein J0L92_34915 [Deltaproteobacteria bacterium]|nr:hypothetical protein [Deltaproteobacteria bacterium]
MHASSSTRPVSPWLAIASFLALAGLTISTPTFAQTLEEEMAATEGGDGSTDTSSTDVETADTADGTTSATGGHELNDDQAVYEERTGGDEAIGPSETDPRERPDTDYFFLGAFARGVIVPTFIQGLLVQYSAGQGSTGEPVNMGAGGFFTWRRNGFGVTAEVWYLGFGSTGYYHGLGAADDEYERIESNLGVVFGNFLFGWSIDITEWLGFDIGFGLGFGGMVGNIYRTEAYRQTGTQELAACTGPGTPAASGCESSLELRGTGGRLDDTRQRGGTYQRFVSGDPTVDARNGANPWYFGDGGIPPMFFWLDLPRIGLRIKPIRQIQIQINGGYNLYGFNFGGSLAYGF